MLVVTKAPKYYWPFPLCPGSGSTIKTSAQVRAQGNQKAGAYHHHHPQLQYLQSPYPLSADQWPCLGVLSLTNRVLQDSYCTSHSLVVAILFSKNEHIPSREENRRKSSTHAGGKTRDIRKIIEVGNRNADMGRPGFSSATGEKYNHLTAETLME